MKAFAQHLIDQYGYQSQHDQHLVAPKSESASINLMPISQQRLLQCQGPDAAKFLQGQLTCDVNSVTQEYSQFGAHCTPKGRALSSFRLALFNEETFLIGCHQSVQETIQTQLGKYIVFSKATLAEPSDEWVCIGMEGAEATSKLSSLGFKPEQQTSRLESSLCIQLGDSQQCYEIWTPCDQAISLWDQLAQNAHLCSSHHWDLALIKAGIGQVQSATSDAFVAQMLNLDAIDAISFTKGCYTGQEIIARAKYRGQVKRRMIRAQVKLQNADSPITKVGDSVLLDEKEVGSVVLAAKDSEMTYQLLAVVKDSVMESQDLSVAAKHTSATPQKEADLTNAEQNTEMQNLQMLTLPYAIPK